MHSSVAPSRRRRIEDLAARLVQSERGMDVREAVRFAPGQYVVRVFLTPEQGGEPARMQRSVHLITQAMPDIPSISRGEKPGVGDWCWLDNLERFDRLTGRIAVLWPDHPQHQQVAAGGGQRIYIRHMTPMEARMLRDGLSSSAAAPAPVDVPPAPQPEPVDEEPRL